MQKTLSLKSIIKCKFSGAHNIDSSDNEETDILCKTGTKGDYLREKDQFVENIGILNHRLLDQGIVPSPSVGLLIDLVRSTPLLILNVEDNFFCGNCTSLATLSFVTHFRQNI